MAVAAVKTWIDGEVLTHTDLNAEFANILSNGETLGWPATTSKDLDGNELILDADGDTSITADTDDQIDFRVGGSDLLSFTASAFALAVNMTNSVQPAFLAYNSATDLNQIGTAGTGAVTVDFDTEVFDQGADFAADTFTAPVTGRYLLSTTVKLSGITAAADQAILRLITTNRTYDHTLAETNGLHSTTVLSLTVVADMTATDTATVTVEVQGEATDVVDIEGGTPIRTMFSGYLVA